MFRKAYCARGAKVVEYKRLALEKAKLRGVMLERLSNQKEEERQNRSRRVKDKLFRLDIFNKVKVILFYVSFKGEVETSEMIKEARRRKKIVAVPVCDREAMSLEAVLMNSGEKMQKGPYSVKEPVYKRYVPLELIDMVIVPGLAFDKDGRRLGRGKGFYDRFLKSLSPRVNKVGLAFSFQMFKQIPHSEETDMKVNKVLFA